MKIKTVVSVIFTIIITLALDTILQAIFPNNQLLTLVALAESFLIIFFTSKFLNVFFYREEQFNKMDEPYLIGELKKTINEIKNDTCKMCKEGIDNNNFGIILSSDLPIFEKKCQSEVWILAFDLHTEKREDVQELVRNNLKRGIKYKYFISDNYKVKLDAKELIRKFDEFIGDPKDYEFYFIQKDYFFFINGLDIVIYDPKDLDYYNNDSISVERPGRRAYVSLKSSIDEKWYEVPLSDDLIDEIILMTAEHMKEVVPIRKN